MLLLVVCLLFYFDPGADDSHFCLERPAVAAPLEHGAVASDRCRLLVRLSPSLPEGEQPRENGSRR